MSKVDPNEAPEGYMAVECAECYGCEFSYISPDESARSAALSAVRSGAARAEVLAVVPVGTARRGAEWQPTEAGGGK